MIVDAIILIVALALLGIGLWLLWNATAGAWGQWRGGR